MKKNNLNDYRGKSIQEIDESLKDLSVKLTSAYLTKSAGKLQNVSMIKSFRRDIAQLKTIKQEKIAESQS